MRLQILLAIWLAAGAPPWLAEKVSYRYDEAGRLVGVDYESGGRITYNHDAAGNLLRREVTGGEIPAAQFRNLPMVFEPNRGQAAPDVKFLARGSRMRVLLSEHGAEFLPAGALEPVRMTLVGARKNVRMQGQEALPGESHYLTGKDASAWKLKIPHYARVEVREVYPGVDVLYYGSEGSLEFDLLVHPGADPGRIQMRYQGARSLRVTAEGDLMLDLGGSELRQRRPVVYQKADGGKVEVAGRYVVKGNRVEFQLAGYDNSRALVIDPVVDVTTTYGGSGDDIPWAATTDAAGNIYITGGTNSMNFPVSGGVQRAIGGGYDVFLLKLNPSGTTVLFSTFLGGSAQEEAYSVALDAAGNPILCGYTHSTNFPVTSGAFQTLHRGSRDGFVAKLNSAGNALLFSTLIGGSGFDQANAVGLDSAGNVYVAGWTGSTNFPTTPGAYAVNRPGGNDGFVMKLDATGSRALYSTHLGGTLDDFIQAMGVTASGIAYLTGLTRSPNFPTTPNAPQRSAGGAADAFLARLSATGETLDFSTYLGGRGEDVGRTIGVDDAGSVFVAGSTTSADFPTSPAFPSPFRGGLSDAFLSAFQFSSGATSLLRSVLCCGDGGDQYWGSMAVAKGADGRATAVYTVGHTNISLSATRAAAEAPSDADPQLTNCPSNGMLNGIFSPLGALLQAGCRGTGAGNCVTAGRNGPIAVGPGQAPDARERVNKVVVVVPVDTEPEFPTSAQNNNNGVVGDPVSSGSGELYQETADLRLGGRPVLEFRRYYASFLAEAGVSSALGSNWMHNFDVRLSVAGQTASVRMFRGKNIAFRKSGSAWSLPEPEQRNYQLLETATAFQFLDPWRNRIYTFTPAGALTRIEDRNGNGLAITPSALGPASVTDGLGRTLVFVYSGGKLVGVQDPWGRSISFTHTGDDLAGYTDANGKTTRYAYSRPGARPGLLSATTLPAGNTPFRQEFDNRGRVTRQIDSRGNAVTLEYDTPAAGETRMVDASSNVTRHAHRMRQNLTSAADADGRASSFAYDAANRRTSVTNREGAATAMEYDLAGNPTAYTDTEGNRTRFIHVSQQQGGFTFHNLARIEYADGSAASMRHDAAGNVVGYVDQAGKSWTYSYDNRGRLLNSTNPAGGVTSRTYNSDSTLASMKLATDDTYTWKYDSRKRPAGIVYPDGAERSLSYDENDRLVSLTDPGGKTRRFVRDDNGNLRSITDPAGQTTRIEYDTDGRVTSVTDRAGGSWTRRYDQGGRLSLAANAAGDAVSLQYDRNNRPVSVQDAAGKVTRTAYNNEGLTASLSDPLSRVWNFTRDRMGRATRVTSPAGRRFDFSYDRMGRLTRAANSASETETLTYDARGMVSGIMVSGGIGTKIARNDLGLVSEVEDPGGNSWKFGYDAAGRRVSFTDPLARTLRYGYDSRSRLTAVTLPEGSIRLGYDAAGNLNSRTYSDGVELQFQYDNANRVVGGSGFTLGYDAAGRITHSNGLVISRDAAGRISAVTFVAEKTVRYSYDGRGLLTRVTDWLGGVTELSYDDGRQLVALSRPNGVTTRYGYDADGNVIEIIEGEAVAWIRLERDGAGKIITADRNLPRAPELTPGVAQRTYDVAHQVAGTVHDSLGRPLADEARRYQWDLAGRLVAHGPEDSLIEHRYDAMGMRIQRKAGGKTRAYIWNYALRLPSISIVREAEEDLRYYVHLPEGLLLYSIEAVDNARRFYHFDEQGSTTFLTDDGGAITDSYGITPYGEFVSRNGSTENPFTFQGEYGVMQEDESSLYYMRLRFYDGAAARFLSKDPLLTVRPLEINPYSFARANPMRFRDPLGAQPAPPAPPLTSQITDVDLYQFTADPGCVVWIDLDCARPTLLPEPEPVTLSPVPPKTTARAAAPVGFPLVPPQPAGKTSAIASSPATISDTFNYGLEDGGGKTETITFTIGEMIWFIPNDPQPPPGPAPACVETTLLEPFSFKLYFNPLGRPADAIMDTSAFATCP